MSNTTNLRLRMYVTAAVIFALAFAVLYALLGAMGVGVISILLFAAVLLALQWCISPVVLEKLGGIRYIGAEEYPKLHAMVKMLAGAAGVPEPRIAISNKKDPNAYVFGRTKKNATLVVHEGLMSLLNEDELEAVLGHEVGHLKHNDVAMMTLISFLPLLTFVLAQNFFLANELNGKSNSNDKDFGTGFFVLFGIVAFLAYFVLQVIMLSLSRMRESYADEYSAAITKKPDALASSLLKITASNAMTGLGNDSTAARAFCIVDSMVSKKDVAEIEHHEAEIARLLPHLGVREMMHRAERSHGGVHQILGIFTTHPPAYKRVLRLAKLSDEMRAIKTRT